MLFDDAIELEKLNEAYTKCILRESSGDELFSANDLKQFEQFFGIKMNNLEFPTDLYELLTKKPEVQTKKSKRLSKEAKKFLCDIWIGTQEIAIAKFLKDNGISIKPKEIHTENDYYTYKQSKPGKIEFKINLTPKLLSAVDPSTNTSNESINYTSYDNLIIEYYEGETPWDGDDDEYEYFKDFISSTKTKNTLSKYLDGVVKSSIKSKVAIYDSPNGVAIMIPKADANDTVKQIVKDFTTNPKLRGDYEDAIENDWFVLNVTDDPREYDSYFDTPDIKEFKNKVNGDIVIISLEDELIDGKTNKFNESKLTEAPSSSKTKSDSRHSKRGKDGRFKPKTSTVAKKVLTTTSKAALDAGKAAGKAALKGGKLAVKGLSNAIQKGIDATGLTSYKVSDKVKNELFNSLNVKNVLPAEYTKTSAAENAKNKNMLLSYLAKNVLSSILTSSGTIKGGLINGKFLIKNIKGQPVIKGECTFV